MQTTTVAERSNQGLSTLVIYMGIGLAVLLFVGVIAHMGLLRGLLGSETAVANNGVITIISKDMRFNTSEIHVKVGQTITIQLDNGDLYAHSFDVDNLNVHTTMPANRETAVTFTATKPGIYTFYCGVPGHQQAGMVGKIIVEP